MYSLLLGHMLTQQLPVAAALHSLEKIHFFQVRTIGDERKNPSEGEECAELLSGYEKGRTDPTVMKFLILHNH